MDEMRMAQVSVERVHARTPAASYVLWILGSTLLFASIAGTVSAATSVCQSTSCSVQSTLGMALGLLGMFAGALLAAFGFATRIANRKRVEDEHHRRLIKLGTDGRGADDDTHVPLHFLD